jgi:hypothetical protein
MSMREELSATPWQELDGEECATAVTTTIRTIREAQSASRENDLRHLRMYRNMALAGMGATTFSRSNAGQAPLSLNIVRNMVNAVTSKVTKHRPKGTFQTYGAGYKTRRKARDLEQFAEGMFYKERFRQKVPAAFRNLGILGTGIIKVCPVGGGKICMENVFTPELTIDSAEGMHREPRNWYQSKYVDKRWLAARAPDEKTKEAILALKANETDTDEAEAEFFSYRDQADMVRLDEAYHLASGPKEGDGCFVQAVQGVLIVKKPWKWDFAPYAVARWSESPLGFWGMGLAEELVGIQVEINRLVRKIQTSFQLLANPYVLADRASNIARSSITDIPGSVILYNGREPRVYAPSTVSPEVFSHLDRLYQRAYELAGISQLSAQSQKPVGFESGRAILVFEDIESDRFSTVYREWENLHMRAIELGLWASEEEKGYWVPAKKALHIEKMKYSDVGIERTDVMTQILPTSVLGDTPSGQLEELARLQKEGIISGPEDMADQILDPDVKAVLNRVAAPKRLVEKLVSDMLEGGDYHTPEPFMDLQNAMLIAQSMYLEALEEGGHTPTELRNVRKFMNAISSLVLISKQKAEASAPAPAGAMPANTLPPGAMPPGAMPPPPPGAMPPPGAPIQ